MNLYQIETRPQAIKALKSLGFVESTLVLTLGAKTFEGFGVSITLGPAGKDQSSGNFIATDKQQELGCVSMMLTSVRAGTLLHKLFEAGILMQDGEISRYGLAVGIGALAQHRSQNAASTSVEA